MIELKHVSQNAYLPDSRLSTGAVSATAQSLPVLPDLLTLCG